MARYRGRHRAPSGIDMGGTGRAVARTALAGAVAGAPLLVAAPAAQAASGASWDRLAECESGGNWAIDTGNGYSGGLQFHPQTWRGFGGTEFAPAAHEASRAEQIVVAERVLEVQGWNAWPACSRKMGLRGEPATPRTAPAEQSAADEPADKPAADEPAADEPAAEKPAAEKPAAEKPAAEKPAAEQPERVRLSAPSTDGGYVVQAGDTLSEIAAQYDVAGGWQTLAAKNPALGDPDLIFPGQRLTL